MKILPAGIPWNPAEPFPLIAAEGVVVVLELKMAGCCGLASQFSDAARTSKEPRHYAARQSQPFGRDEGTWQDVTHGESIADVRQDGRPGRPLLPLGARSCLTVRGGVGQDWPGWTVDLFGPHSEWFAYFDIWHAPSTKPLSASGFRNSQRPHLPLVARLGHKQICHWSADRTSRDESARWTTVTNLSL